MAMKMVTRKMTKKMKISKLLKQSISVIFFCIFSFFLSVFENICVVAKAY